MEERKSGEGKGEDGCAVLNIPLKILVLRQIDTCGDVIMTKSIHCDTIQNGTRQAYGIDSGETQNGN